MNRIARPAALRKMRTLEGQIVRAQRSDTMLTHVLIYLLTFWLECLWPCHIALRDASARRTCIRRGQIGLGW